MSMIGLGWCLKWLNRHDYAHLFHCSSQWTDHQCHPGGDDDENAGTDSNDNAEDDDGDDIDDDDYDGDDGNGDDNNDDNDSDDSNDDDDGDDSNGGKFTQIADPIQVFPIQAAHCSIRFDDNKPSYLCS